MVKQLRHKLGGMVPIRKVALPRLFDHSAQVRGTSFLLLHVFCVSVDVDVDGGYVIPAF